MSITAQAVKKFVNDPEDGRPRGARRRSAAAHPGLVRVDPSSSCPARRRAGARQGRPRLRRRIRPRAAARRLRRARHARRRLCRRGLHLPRARPDGAPPRGPSTAARACCTSSRTTRATCSTSGWPRSWPRTRASRSPRCCWTTTWPCRTRSTRPGRRGTGRDRAGREDRRRQGGGRAARSPRSPTSRAGSTSAPAPSGRPDVVRHAGQGHADLRPRRRRDRGRRRHPRRAGPAAREA